MQVEYRGVSFERPGHGSVRIEPEEGVVVYIDPWSEVIDGTPEDAEVILVSHDDFDHYDPDGIDAVATPTTTIIAHEAIDPVDLSHDVIQLGEGDCVEVRGMLVVATPAYNRPDGPHVRDSGEPYHPEGTVIGFLFNIGEISMYYPSDTDVLSPLLDIEADVIFPPIGGTYTMGPTGAKRLIDTIEPDLVLPVHYNTDGIGGLDVDAEQFKQDVADMGVEIELF